MKKRILTFLAALLLLGTAASAQYNRLGFSAGLSYADGAPRQNTYGFEIMASSYIFHPTPFFIDFGLEGDMRHLRGSMDEDYRIGIPVNLVLDIVDFTQFSYLCVYGGVTGAYNYCRPYSLEAGPHDQEGRFLASGNLGATLYLYTFYLSAQYTRDLMDCKADGTRYHGFRFCLGLTLGH